MVEYWGSRAKCPAFCYFWRMVTAAKMLARIRAINLQLEAQIAIELTAKAATSAIKDQLYTGTDMNDKEILPPYANVTKLYKIRKGQRYDRVTLKDTGAFYRGILIDVRNNGTFTVQSADSKANQLLNKYGDAVLGFGTLAKKEYVNPALRPQLIKQLRNGLRGKV